MTFTLLTFQQKIALFEEIKEKNLMLFYHQFPRLLLYCILVVSMPHPHRAVTLVILRIQLQIKSMLILIKYFCMKNH